MRVLFITNIPSPYRVDFFNEVGKHCSLTVLFEGRSGNHRNDAWYNNDFWGFQAIFLKQKRVLGKLVCPDVTKYLKQNYDIVVLGNYNSLTGILSILTMRRNKRPFFISADGGIIRKREIFIKRQLKRFLIGSASYWLSSSNNTDHYLEFYGAKKENIYRYNFTSLNNQDLSIAKQMICNKKSIKETLGIQESIVVLTVGRFNLNGGYGKGFDTVMKIAEEFKEHNIGFYIVGDNPTDEFVEWKTEKKLENVHFVGFQDKEHIRNYYASADVFILMTRSDVWGLVINEAMSYSLPIITTDQCVAGLELVKDDWNGFILEVDDSLNAIRAIRYIIDNSKQEEFGKNSYSTIEEFTIEKMAQQHLDIWSRLYDKDN